MDTPSNSSQTRVFTRSHHSCRFQASACSAAAYQVTCSKCEYHVDGCWRCDPLQFMSFLRVLCDKKDKLGQHRTTTGSRLCTSYACIFSVILPKFSLTCVSKPASNLDNLTKNLTTHLTHNGRAVLPLIKRISVVTEYQGGLAIRKEMWYNIYWT